MYKPLLVNVSVSLIVSGVQLHMTFVLHLQPFKISLGFLLTPGISVDLNMSIASHAFSAFFTKIYLIVWTIHSTLPTD